MLLRTVYTVSPGAPGLRDKLELPFKLPLAEGVRGALDEHEGALRLSVCRSVDPSKIQVKSERNLLGEEARRLALGGDEPRDHLLAKDFVSAVTFLTDVPLSLSRRFQEDRFIPLNQGERRLLKRLGTDVPHQPTSAQARSRTFDVPVDVSLVSAVIKRSAGVRLYADAVKLTGDVAQFRELWRVLESAFARKDEELLGCLDSYPPAKELKFHYAELKGLWILRGQASHAESKRGVSELARVEQKCGKRLPRLKNLVERVVLTKKSWGLPTLGVDELVPLRAYLDLDESR